MMTICRNLAVVGLLSLVSVGIANPHGVSAAEVGAAQQRATVPAAHTAPRLEVAATSRAPSAKKPPSQPVSVTVTPGDRSVRLTWKKPKRTGSHPISGYRVQRSLSGGAWTTVTTVGPKVRGFTVGPLPTATSIRLRVAAVSRGGTSKWSSVRSAVLPTVLQVSMGESSTCALLPSLVVACWGQNSKGQLGIGNSAIPRIPVPVLVPGLTDVREISSGQEHHCARRGNGTVWCWGYSVGGQLTIASIINHAPSPVEIPGVTAATQISAGLFHTCVRTSSGGAQCWGGSATAQLGAPTVDGLATVGLAGVVEVRAGGRHTCARLASGAVHCWGQNARGEAGGPPGGDVLTPAVVPGISSARGLALGESHSCAHLADGSARCWGRGDSGQLGDGSTPATTSVPQTVVDAGTISSMSAGRMSTCAVYADASVRCWGTNFFGNLGTGSAGGNPSSPVLSNFGPATVTSQGWSHGCSIGTNGRLRCAGRNHEGQLGNGSTTNSATPVSPNGY
jgi:alpha-tubulin suppressor-like RCC1 family protein